MKSMSNNGMSDDNDRVCEFQIDTNFQKMARRPGGIARDQALKNASANIDTFRPGFEDWLDAELEELMRVVPNAEPNNRADLSWIDAAETNSHHLADIAATMDYQFVSFVAKNLCLIFDAIRHGAEFRGEVITCHINALQLARQQQYRKLRSEDLPELSEGLRRILDSPRSQR